LNPSLHRLKILATCPGYFNCFIIENYQVTKDTYKRGRFFC
jgi:hypothetical protein